MKKVYEMEVDCANCAAKIEEKVKKIDGVLNANISFINQKMTIEIDDSYDFDKVMKQVVKTSKKVEPDCEIKL